MLSGNKAFSWSRPWGRIRPTALGGAAPKPAHGSRRQVTVLHADIVGSTAMVRSDLEIGHRRIRHAFERFAATIVRHGGEVLEIRGDALVAAFEDSNDAVAAALDYQQLNQLLNTTRRGSLAPSVRVGLANGEIFFADGLTAGEAVVLAQRLEQVCPPGGLCVDEAVYANLRGDVRRRSIQPAPTHSFKGFEEGRAAFLIAPGESFAGHRRAQSGTT